MVTLSNTFTLPSSQSGSTSSLSVICSFTNADNELAFTVSVISEPYPSFLSASYNSALFSLTTDAYSLVQRYGSDYAIGYDKTIIFGTQTITNTYDDIQNGEDMTLSKVIDETYSDYAEWQDTKKENGYAEEARKMYRYYYIACPSCGGKMGIYGHSSSDSHIKTVQCFNCGYQTQMSAFNIIEKWSEKNYDDVELNVLNAEAEYTFTLGDVWFVDRFDELSGNNEKTQYRYKSLLTPKKYVYEQYISDGLTLQAQEDAAETSLMVNFEVNATIIQGEENDVSPIVPADVATDEITSISDVQLNEPNVATEEEGS